MKYKKRRKYMKEGETEVDRRKKKRRKVEGIALRCKDGK